MRMDSKVFSIAALLGLIVVAVVTRSRHSSLERRLEILEASAQKPATELKSPGSEQMVRDLCRAFKGRVVGQGPSVECELAQSMSSPREFNPQIQKPHGISTKREPKGSANGGVEVHYPDWNLRQCIEAEGDGVCDPVSKVLSCKLGRAVLIRVAYTKDGRGLRNRYACVR